LTVGKTLSASISLSMTGPNLRSQSKASRSYPVPFFLLTKTAIPHAKQELNQEAPMKALVKRHRQPGLWLEDVPVPEYGINDVLIEILKTGICGTDLHIYNWDAWAQKTIPVPMVVGHEFVGRIVATGANVHDFAVGDIVSGEGHVVCGRCRNCLAGRRHLCKNTLGVGVNRPGAFAEFLALPVTNVWLHDSADGTHISGISRDVQSIFDPFGNAVHTALSFDVLGEDVLITGAGPIGCMAAGVAKHAGARHVVVTDVNPWRLALAGKLGATRTVDVRTEKLADVQKQLGMREGFDVGLEMSGNASAFRDLLANMCHGGRVAMLGIPPGEISIDWNLVIFNMLTIKGIYGREMYETWYKMTVMLQSGLDIAPVITHRLPCEDFETGFAAMRSGEAGKVVLTWKEER
jgi:threonine 3-dehydrogenase